MIDASGYPTEELLAELRGDVGEHDSGRLPERTVDDVCDDLLARAAEAINATGYGRAWQEVGFLRIATGGWSGCEDIVEALMGNIFGRMRWESSHRGGLHVFKLGGNDV